MELRAQGEASGVEPGRRFLTVLFADLSRSTELAELMEAEHYAAMLAALRRIYHETIPRHGGIVVRVQGDGLLAMFGYPVTRETDGRGAVAAALEMHQRVGELRIALPEGFALCLHTGIHAGLVLVRSGDVELGRFELLGTVPNIASRLSDTAAPHEVLVSEETLGPASRFFVTSPPTLLQVKGRAAPLLVYRVDARASPAERPAAARHGDTPFVGREAELALLAAALDEAAAGRVGAVAVAGEPGMGKTRLIEHFLARAVQRGCSVLRGYCDSDLAAEPLQPFRHMLPSAAGQPSAATPDEFAALFGRLAAAAPLLLFVDDWQWADDASHQVLAALRQRGEGRILLVVSMRADASARARAGVDRTIELPPLGDAEAARAIAARLPGADPFVVDAIRRQANGNPLFLEELCHWAQRRQAGERDLALQAGAGWLKQLVESRVQRLSAAQIGLVRVAAVIGNVVPAWLLERMTGQAADGPVQLGLAEQDFLFPGERAGTLRFKHGLTRDIIYESVGLHVRQELHLRIAEALRLHGEVSGDDALEAMARHYDAGGDAVQAARHAQLAGDRALAASALDRARALYRLALAALDRQPQTREVALRWVDVVQSLGRISVFDPVRGELPLYRSAVDLAQRHGDIGTVARARHWLSYFLYGLGDARASIVQAEQALAEARQAQDEKLAARVVASLGEAHCAAANYDTALVLLEEAIAIKARHRSSRHVNVGLVFSLVCKAYLLGDQGRFAEAFEAFDEASSCLAGATHEIGATVLGWRAAVLLWQGRWADAREAAEASARMADATRSLTQLSIARAIASYADWMLTQRVEHLEAIVEVTAWLGPSGTGLFRSLNHGWLADGLMRAGRRAEARRHAARALQRARQGDLLGVAMSYRALARDAAATRPQRVPHYLARAMQAAQRRGSAHELAATRLCRAELAWRDQDGDGARAALDEAEAGFRALRMPWHLEQATRLRQAMAPAALPASTA